MGPIRQKISFLVTLTGILTACGGKPAEAPLAADPMDPNNPPELRMEKMRTQSFGPSGVEWELITPSAQGFSKQNKMYAQDIKIVMYEKGRKSTDLTANEGVIRFEDTQVSSAAVPVRLKQGAVGLGPGDLYLTGDVVAVSTEGSKLFTDWLRYDKSSGLITSTAPVRVVREDSITEGVGMEATSDLSQVKIFKQTVTIKEKALKKKK